MVHSAIIVGLSVVFCAAAIQVWAKEIEFENCGGEVQSVFVEGCTTDPCEFKRGESVAVTARCLSNVDAQKLKLSIWATVAGMEAPFPGMNRNACKNKNLTCPISKGEEISYTLPMKLRSFFPKIDTVARFILETNDDQDMTVCCFKAPVRVI